MKLSDIINAFRKKPDPIEEKSDWDPDFVEEYVYMGDGTMELVRTPRSEYTKRMHRIEKSFKDQVKETQNSIAESKRRQERMKSSYHSQSNSGSSRSTAQPDTAVSSVAFYAHSSSSYDSSSSSCDSSSSSSSCD